MAEFALLPAPEPIASRGRKLGVRISMAFQFWAAIYPLWVAPLRGAGLLFRPARVRGRKLTVDQEVCGSNPPSCTSAQRNFLDKIPLAHRAPVALTHSHASLELPSFPRRGEK